MDHLTTLIKSCLRIKVYHLVCVRGDKKTYLTGYAMPHKKCETMYSKFNNETKPYIMFEQVLPEVCSPVPELCALSGSWVICSKATGRAVLETFNRDVAGSVNQEKYFIETAYTYLTRLNREIQESKDALTVQGK